MTDQEDNGNVAEDDADTSAPPSDNGDTEQQENESEHADHFPRDYVERLRKESAGYRTERDQLRELLAASQRQQIDTQIVGHGLKPEAVWSVVDGPDDLLGDDGQPDQKKIGDAVKAARERLGIKPERRYGVGLSSGASSGPQLPRSQKFVDAFAPRRDR